MNSTEPEFWDSRYRAGRMPWDCRGVPPALTAYLETLPRRGSVFIPGCGSGYEVRAFHDHGWEVLAMDFSAAAVQRAEQLLGPLADRVLLADFFQHDFHNRRFDLVYERTFLCSLPPALWRPYARRVADLLVDRGRLIGFFFYGHEDEPPPYPLTDSAARAVFRKDFTKVADEPVENSLPLYAGRERWQVWERRLSQTAGGDAR